MSRRDMNDPTSFRRTSLLFFQQTFKIPWLDESQREKPTPIKAMVKDQKVRVLQSPERRIEIGLNVIAIHDLDDTHHMFQCNMLLHMWWNARPLNWNGERKTQFPPAFIPWIQLHNLREMVHEVSENRGLSFTEREVLNREVESFYANPSNAHKPCNKFENRNFVAQFINTLDLKNFPFDSQQLKITLVNNMTKETTFTQKVVREKEANDFYSKCDHPNYKQGIKWFEPVKDDKDATGKKSAKTRIKCNLEGETISEWDILYDDQEKKIDGNSSTAVAVYTFREHDPAMSAEGSIYQRLDFYIVAHREYKNFLWSVIGPSFLLCAGSFSVFAMDVEDGLGDRLSILVTIVLAVIANSIATQGRLPRVDYLTWADWVLGCYQFFVYVIMVAVSVLGYYAPSKSTDDIEKADFITFIVLFTIFVIMNAAFGIKAWLLARSRMWEGEKEVQKGRSAFWKEEDRIFEIETGIARRTDPEDPYNFKKRWHFEPLDPDVPDNPYNRNFILFGDQTKEDLFETIMTDSDAQADVQVHAEGN